MLVDGEDEQASEGVSFCWCAMVMVSGAMAQGVLSIRNGKGY